MKRFCTIDSHKLFLKKSEEVREPDYCHTHFRYTLHLSLDDCIQFDTYPDLIITLTCFDYNYTVAVIEMLVYVY